MHWPVGQANGWACDEQFERSGLAADPRRRIPTLDAEAMAARAQVVLDHPYTRYGLPPVAACAKAGTDYADLTGELMFWAETASICTTNKPPTRAPG